MSSSSIIPERQLVFSPELAATIGLEEAILLQQLQLLFDHYRPQPRGGYAYYTVQRDYLLRALPFWNTEDLQRITRGLADKGVLLIDSPPLLSCDALVFAVNEPHATAAPTTPPATQPNAPQRRSAGLLPAHWSPSEDLLQLLSLNHNIPRQFALDQLEDFVFYWRERGETSHAWENKFRQHVVSHWRRQQQASAEGFRVADPPPLDRQWRPSPDAMDIMARAGIDAEFIEQAIPEFILYWLERGAPPKELNTRFIQHIRLQWAKYTSSLSHSTEPRRISDDWQPADDVFDILQLSHIDSDFARSLLPEFIVYWKESNQVQTSWNSKFIQHVKYHWAKSHHIEQAGNTHAGHQGTRATGRTRDRSLQDDLTDTSWAD
ncbi:MAG: DnaT-like ssDNA-binding domain-containing protein [Gammaproteobacteria bacterium]|nr:DnaT-like ssDNA-binding domain-containing protein [Gammaproteobacteria bacterium]